MAYIERDRWCHRCNVTYTYEHRCPYPQMDLAQSKGRPSIMDKCDGCTTIIPGGAAIRELSGFDLWCADCKFRSRVAGACIAMSRFLIWVFLEASAWSYVKDGGQLEDAREHELCYWLRHGRLRLAWGEP